LSSIGIIANPASGKDIRRLVSYATTIDNQEKVNIVKRIVLAAQSVGVDKIYFMPDSFQFGWVVIDDLEIDGNLTASCEVLQIPYMACAEDTVRTAAWMEGHKLGCVVVLGGDGTSRAAAKSLKNVPLVAVSTGTNNVYPDYTEGTVAGMAAGITAGADDPEPFCLRDKRIEVSVDGEFQDIALVDAVVSDDLWVGSRAIWDADKIEYIVAARAHPASIGFSAAAGCLNVIRPEDDRAVVLQLCGDDEEKAVKKIKAPVAAGILSPLNIQKVQGLSVGEEYFFTASHHGMIALDGERELRIRKGQTVSFKLTRNGPLHVDIEKTLEKAVQYGLFSRD
jgi:predicted polyphosphate/ATP-dependent NAD kinase